MTAESLLTRAEVAALLGVPAATIAQWAYRGEGPPFYKVGRHARYKLVDVERWLETCRRGGPEPVADLTRRRRGRAGAS